MSFNLIKKIDNLITKQFSKYEIRKLFWVFLTLFSLAIIGIFVIANYKTMYKVVYNERVQKLSYIGDFAIELLKDQSQLVKEHKKTLKQAQADSIQTLKDVRFENNDYIWVHDFNGKMIYHPYEGLIGTNVGSYKDPRGYNFGKQLIEVPLKHGAGFVVYYWPKRNESESFLYPKVSFVIKFDDWNWIIGTGAYVNDIKLNVLHSMLDGAIPVIIAVLLIVLLSRYIILRTIVQPLEELSDKSMRLVYGGEEVEILPTNNDTEIGRLYDSFSKFFNHFKIERDIERKLLLIHDNINEVILTVDELGQILSTNRAIKGMFGYSTGEIIGKNINLLTSPTMFDEMRSSKDAKIRDRVEILGIRKNEEFFHIEVSINKSYYNEKPVFIVLIRDITEQKEIERMKNEFVSVVSHELRTPLTSIRGALGLALSGVFKEVDGKLKNLIDVAHKNSLRLVELINDILDIEKMAAGKMAFEFESLSLARALQDSIAMNLPYAIKFDVKFELRNNTGADTKIKVDKARFFQVLTNVLSNACKFSPAGSSVVIEADLIGDIVKISVKDKGRGIPLKYQDSVFSKFTQVDSSDSREKGGTGLGLSICKNLVEKMNGKISFESEENVGTTFYIEFKVVKDNKIQEDENV